MTIYLLRHAEAEAMAASDHGRCLTDKGRAQAERTGKFCRRHDIVPDIILSSPVTRAKQTAKIVAGELGGPELVEVPWAACGMDPWNATDELKNYAKFSSAMLVGHQPDLGALAALMLGISDVAALHVRKSLLCAIATDATFRGGVLEFFIPARLMD